MSEFVAWTDIEGLHNVIRTLKKSVELGYPIPTVTYRPKIKLHGTNAGVRVYPDGRVIAQSRSSDLVDSDNAGFAAWVKGNEDWFRDQRFNLINHLNKNQKSDEKSWGTIIFFGEWCGPGIQKGCAIHQIDKKIFAIFSIAYEHEYLFTDPTLMDEFIDSHPDVYIICWGGDEITLDFFDREDLEKKIDLINSTVLEVEKEDPWVKTTFGISGTGEGLVYYPIVNTHFAPWDSITRYIFKAKGEKHKMVEGKKRDPVQIDPERAESTQEFVKMFVSAARCDQGLTEACGGEFDLKFIGKFIGWMGKDVLKESVAELEASNLTWKEVAKEVTSQARNWYLTHCKSL